MENFCGKCGSKLDPQTGLCPKCSTGQIPEGAKQVRQSGNSNRPMHFLKWMLIAIAFLAIAAGIMYCLAYFGVVNLTGLPGLPCQHEWVEATCTTPRTCSLCGETDGEPLGHSWKNADCTTPRTCSLCGETDGEPLGHNWKNADCTSPKICERCHETVGTALGHNPGELEEETDYTVCERTISRHCTRCHELLESETEEITITTLLDEGGFICSPHDMLERLKAYAVMTDSTAHYETEDDASIAFASLVYHSCEVMILFIDRTMSLTESKDFDTNGFYCISASYLSTADEINPAYVADFCNACDPQLGSAAEETAQEIIRAGQDALSRGEEAALYQKNGVVYEIVAFPNEAVADPYGSILTIAARPEAMPTRH